MSDLIRVEVWSKNRREWQSLEVSGRVSKEMLQQARHTFRTLVKDKSDQLGFTPNDWAKRAMRDLEFPPQVLTGFDLFALVHAVKCWKIRVDGEVWDQPYPVLGEN